MHKDIYVFIEQIRGEVTQVSYELLGEARRLAEVLGCQVVAMLLGDGVSNIAEQLIGYGADEVIVMEHEGLKDYLTEPYTVGLVQIIKDRKPEILLVGATSIGRDLAPRVSARIKTGLTADCTSLEIDSDTKQLLMTRPAFGGNIMATIICPDYRPQMATVRSGVMEIMEVPDTHKGVVTNMTVTFTDDAFKAKIVDIVEVKNAIENIGDAEIIVAGGRGVGSGDGFELLQTLAKKLGGVVGASRAAVDAGWIAKHCQVGQTGTTVRPKVYFACGISGAIQHVAGMERSDYVIAINKDEDAPIFDYADMGIVGDLHDVIPKLIDQLS